MFARRIRHIRFLTTPDTLIFDNGAKSTVRTPFNVDWHLPRTVSYHVHMGVCVGFGQWHLLVQFVACFHIVDFLELRMDALCLPPPFLYCSDMLVTIHSVLWTGCIGVHVGPIAYTPAQRTWLVPDEFRARVFTRYRRNVESSEAVSAHMMLAS